MMTKSQRQKAIARHIDRVQTRLKALKAASHRFSWVRLILVLAGLATGISASFLGAELAGWIILALTLVMFNVVAFYHRRIDLSIRKHQIWLRIKETQLARMDLNWDLLAGNEQPQPDSLHPVDVDLNITGSKSLHQLVDIAISTEGSKQLRSWLLAREPDRDIVCHRQKLVKELAPLALFRDKLLLAYNLVSKEELDGQKLVHYLSRDHGSRHMNKILVLLSGLAGLNLLLFGLNKLALLPSFWLISFTVYAIIYFMNERHLASLMEQAVFISEELKKFRAISSYLEHYGYGDNHELSRLCQPFWQPQDRPSSHLGRMTALSWAIGLRMNPVLRIILNIAFPWDFLCAYFLERFKKRLHHRFPDWLGVLFELEGLISLANFAYLNPEYAFPELRPGDERPVFRATALGHPLLPDEVRKTNDFSFAETGDIALITGSNMSGKSTFLKTVGINLSLAFAGGPVAAGSMQTGLFRLFSCIQINDSVTDGFSFFYAEVKRLKALLVELNREYPLPLLFLIDEIFKGTNNRERYIGSRSYIRALAGKNGFGAVSTHDLELTSLDALIPTLSNYHFKEHVENGKMVFDYKLRSGPCPTTNALKIMKLEGLPVDDE